LFFCAFIPHFPRIFLVNYYLTSKAGIFATLFILFTTQVLAQTDSSPEVSLRAILEAPAFANAFWGAHVMDADTGEEIFALHADRSFVPASNTKLYTTAAALVLFGPTYTLETRLWHSGSIRRGTLRGNLLIEASGDPSFGGRYTGAPDPLSPFRTWAEALSARGIRTVQGDIRVHTHGFDPTPLGFGWDWDDEPFCYSAQISALSISDNCLTIELEGTALGEVSRYRVLPALPDGVHIVNQTLTVAPEEPTFIQYDRPRASNTIVLSSRLAPGERRSHQVTFEDPARVAAVLFRHVLQERGIRVQGGVHVSTDPLPEALELVARHVSPDMRALAAAVNKPSQNLYAELLLRQMGRLDVSSTSPSRSMGSAAQGQHAAWRVFRAAGVDSLRTRLVDGSGLSRTNFIDPRSTSRLLHYMWHYPDSEVRDAFVASLPVGGVDGTLAGRFREGPGLGNVRAKTGTLGHASALSGYVTTTSGRTLIFSLVANHYLSPASAARNAQDAFVNALITLP